MNRTSAVVFAAIFVTCAATHTLAAADRFEVVAIRAHPESTMLPAGMSIAERRKSIPRLHMTVSHGRLDAEVVTMAQLIASAYGLEERQIKAPAEDLRRRYSITATMPAGSGLEQFPAMLRNMLAERLHLKAHREMRTDSVYLLVVAKGGAKLKPPEGPERPAPEGELLDMPGTDGVAQRRGTSGSNVRIQIPRGSMASLAKYLATETRRAVLDETGLRGKYDISFDTPKLPAEVSTVPVPGAAPPRPLGPAPIDPGPGLAQLGLRLEAAKRPVEYLVVDSVDAIPTGN
jgi:uncharacterized protein (TIGR03435 family)